MAVSGGGETWPGERCQESMDLADAIFDALRRCCPGCGGRSPQGEKASTSLGGPSCDIIGTTQLMRILAALRDSADGRAGFMSVESAPSSSSWKGTDGECRCSCGNGGRGVGREEFLRTMWEVHGVVGRRAFNAVCRAQIKLLTSHTNSRTNSSTTDSSHHSTARSDNKPSETLKMIVPELDTSAAMRDHDADHLSTVRGTPEGSTVESMVTPLYFRRMRRSPVPGESGDQTPLSHATPLSRISSMIPDAREEPSVGISAFRRQVTDCPRASTPPGQMFRRRGNSLPGGNIESAGLPWDLECKTPSAPRNPITEERLRRRSQTIDQLSSLAAAMSEGMPPGLLTPLAGQGSVKRIPMAPSRMTSIRSSDGGTVIEAAPNVDQVVVQIMEDSLPQDVVLTDAMPAPAPSSSSNSPRPPSSVDSHACWSTPGESMIFLDWDDTLCPTSFIKQDPRLHWSEEAPCFADPSIPLAENDGSESCSSRGNESRNNSKGSVGVSMAEALRRHAEAVRLILRSACALGHVVIITLAKEGWIDISCKNFLPGVMDVLQELHIEVVYARNSLSQWKIRCANADELDLLHLMKEAAMSRGLRKFYSRRPRQSWKNAISIGDSILEKDALTEVIYCLIQPAKNGHAHPCRCKTVKLLEDPDLVQLTAQLDVLTSSLQALVVYDGDIELDFASSEDTRAMFEKIRLTSDPCSNAEDGGLSDLPLLNLLCSSSVGNYGSEGEDLSVQIASYKHLVA